MFKKSVIAAVLFLLSENLIVAQEIDSNTIKNKEIEPTNNVILATKSKEMPAIASKGTVTVNNDSLKSEIEATVDNTIALIPERSDSVFLKMGDVLIGKITIDKDKNAFLFSKDTVQNLELKASDILRLTILPKETDEERSDVFSIFNEFYFLESSPNVPIRVFANRTFKSVLNNGPKYYITQTKYCLFKNDIPYFMKNGRFKETLLFLVNDCKTVVQGFKNGKYNEDNFIEAVTQYNRCNNKK
jgi:hypothetical protein